MDQDRAASEIHPPNNKCVHQPMLEVPHYLCANGFRAFIVWGDGVEFMRAFAETTYGIPPEQVVGNSGVVKFEMCGSKPKESNAEFVDDGPGKRVGINSERRGQAIARTYIVPRV